MSEPLPGNVDFRELVDSMPLGVFVADVEGRSVYYNRHVIELSRKPAEASLGWNWVDRVHPDDREDALRSWERARESGSNWRLEYRVQRGRDGQYTWVQGEAVAIRGPDGAVRCWVGTVVDVADRKAAEQRLAASEARFRTAFFEAPMGIAITSLAEGTLGRYLEANDAFCTFLGRSRAQVLASTFPMVSHPDEHDTDRAVLAALLSGERSSFQRRKRYVRGDGTTVWGRVWIAALSEKDGRPDQAISIVEDVTEAVAAEQEAEFTEQRFRTAVEAAPIGIAVLDLDGMFVDVNASFCRLVGRSRAELLDGVSGLALTPPDDVDAVRHAMRRAVRTQTTLPAAERRCLQPDGSTTWVRVTASLVRDAGGRVCQYLLHCEDADERHRIETELADAEQRLRSTFWASPVGAVLVTLNPPEIVDVNPAFANFLRRPRDELLTLRTLDVIFPEDVADANRVLETMLSVGMPPAAWEQRFRRGDGTEVRGRVTVTVLTDTEGRPARALAQIEDVSALRDTEARLNRSEHLFRIAFESAPTGLSVTDMAPGSEGRFLRVNEAFCELVGYSRDELLQLAVPDITHPEDRGLDWQDYPRLLDGSLESYERTKRYVRADGEIVAVHAKATMVRDETGRPIMSVAHVRPADEAQTRGRAVGSIGAGSAEVPIR